MAPGARRVVVVVTGRDEQLYISFESFNISRSFDTNLCYGKGGDHFATAQFSTSSPRPQCLAASHWETRAVGNITYQVASPKQRP